MKSEIRKGTFITAKHIKSGRVLHYKVIIEKGEINCFRLLNTDSLCIMSELRAIKPSVVIKYIENRLKCEIIEISL